MIDTETTQFIQQLQIFLRLGELSEFIFGFFPGTVSK